MMVEAGKFGHKQPKLKKKLQVGERESLLAEEVTISQVQEKKDINRKACSSSLF